MTLSDSNGYIYDAAGIAWPPEPDYGLQCDPPRSQLEAEQCAELEGNAPEYAPTPEPEPEREKLHA